MDASNKKMLINIAYVGTVLLTIAFSVLFMVAMTLKGVATYQQVIYYIWAILLILTMVLDVMANKSGNLKYIVGLIISGLAFLCLVVGIIVFAGMSVNGSIPYFAGEKFAIVIAFSVALTILSIVAFCVGQKMIEIKQSIKKSK